MRILGSQGVANYDDKDVIIELQDRHPSHSPPVWSDNIPPPLTVDSSSVLNALRAFPRGTSPGASQMHAQHLLDAIDGISTPSAHDCLDSLTVLLCFLLSGQADVRIVPWLTGAPLTALRKKDGGIRPIAVGEVLRRLTSRLCCLAVKPALPQYFLPYGQLGVGVTGGVEAAIHTLSSVITDNGENPDLCCLKIDFKNAFNECSRSSFLCRLHHDFPGLFAWCQWSYHGEGRLRFGDTSIFSTGGVQQGDLLGPLLFSLVVMELLDEIGPTTDINLKLWYLDDGTFVGPRFSLASFLDILKFKGPAFGLIINSRKCEIFWPSGDQLFSEFDSEVIRIGQVSGGIEILGSPVYGSDSFFIDSVGRRVDKVLNCQDHLMDLEDPQVEMHLLRSCLGVCKLNHILRTVPTYWIDQELVRFDSGVRHSLEVLSHSSISDNAWKQATLPIRHGGLGLRESIRTAPAAFIGSCNTTRDLSHQLLLNSSLTISLWELFAESDGRPDTPCDLIIPGELYCHKILSSLLSDSTTLQPFKANQ